MPLLTQQKISNIKYSCQLKEKTGDLRNTLKQFCQENSSVTVRQPNFFVLRKTYVYVIFFTGHVNVTGCSSVEAIGLSRDILLQCLGTRMEIGKITIDNITSSGAINRVKKIRLPELTQKLKRLEIPFRYNPHRFPGLNFKLKSVTVIVFNSGKFILVGSKSMSEIEESVRHFCNVVLHD